MAAEPHARQLPLALRPGDYQRFATFFNGANQSTVQQIIALAETGTPNQIFLSGVSGSGKTHLLHSAVQRAQAVGRSAAYLSLRDLPAPLPAMTEAWESLDLCVLDQFEAVLDAPELQTECFDLYNRIYDHHGTLLAAAPPDFLSALQLPDLRSRLQWGTRLALVPLDDEALATAWRKRAADRGLSIAQPALDYLLNRERRELAVLLQRLDAIDQAALAEQRGKLTIPFLKRVLFS